MNALRELGPSVIRTVTPWLVGLLLTFLAKHSISIEEGMATTVVTTLVSTVYYAVVRVLETRVAPKLGWLLGSPKAPTYEPKP